MDDEDSSAAYLAGELDNLTAISNGPAPRVQLNPFWRIDRLPMTRQVRTCEFACHGKTTSRQRIRIVTPPTFSDLWAQHGVPFTSAVLMLRRPVTSESDWQLALVCEWLAHRVLLKCLQQRGTKK